MILKRYLHDVKKNTVASPVALNGHQWFPYYKSNPDDPKEYFLVFLGLKTLDLIL